MRLFVRAGGIEAVEQLITWAVRGPTNSPNIGSRLASFRRGSASRNVSFFEAARSGRGYLGFAAGLRVPSKTVIARPVIVTRLPVSSTPTSPDRGDA